MGTLSDLRVRAKGLIDEMPEIGLDEAVDSLTLMRDFWLERQAYKPSPEVVPIECVARVGETYTRPEFYVSED